MNRANYLKIFFLVLLLEGAFACDKSQKDVAILTNANNISADIQPFLEKYFSTWSDNDMDAYRSLFDDSAVIMYFHNGKVRSVLLLDKFIEQQASILSRNKGTISERMISFTVDEDAKAATVAVKWIYEGKGKAWTGVDRFSLIRNADGHLKIVALVWYSDELPM